MKDIIVVLTYIDIHMYIQVLTHIFTCMYMHILPLDSFPFIVTSKLGLCEHILPYLTKRKRLGEKEKEKEDC